MFRYADDEHFHTSNIVFEMTGVPETTIVMPIYR